jgi:osmotically-inducible protein OsmY
MSSRIDKRRRAARKAVGKGAGRAAKKGAQTWAALKLLERSALPERRRTRRILLVAVAGGLGLAIIVGPRQRRERTAARVRRGKANAARHADYAAGQMKGAAHEAKDLVTPDSPKPDLTDQQLARKVETIIFRDDDVPKGKINVDAAGATVSLRGEAESQEAITALEDRAAAIPEVIRVENLLHLPGEPAPTRTDVT